MGPIGRRAAHPPAPRHVSTTSIEPRTRMAQDHVVFVVDDDRRIRESLIALLSSFDLHAIAFGSAAEYLAHPKPDVAACLVLDVELPDLNGLELQRRIAEENHPHIVFITGHGDIPSSVRAIRAGAVDFLTKPFEEADLMRAIHAALAQDRDALSERAALDDLRRRLATLTPREREVLPLIASGLLNKQAAAELGISEVTLQIHRGRLMKKLGAASLAALVRMAVIAGIPAFRPRDASG
jgi:FixJ family two-component response regulator